MDKSITDNSKVMADIKKQLESFFKDSRPMTPEEREATNKFFWSQFKEEENPKIADLQSRLERSEANWVEKTDALINIKAECEVAYFGDDVDMKETDLYDYACKALKSDGSSILEKIRKLEQALAFQENIHDTRLQSCNAVMEDQKTKISKLEDENEKLVYEYQKISASYISFASSGLVPLELLNLQKEVPELREFIKKLENDNSSLEVDNAIVTNNLYKANKENDALKEKCEAMEKVVDSSEIYIEYFRSLGSWDKVGRHKTFYSMYQVDKDNLDDVLASEKE